MLCMQVDCAWCVASHDRQSPHFYALCDTPFQAPTIWPGLFLCSGRTVCRGRRQGLFPTISCISSILGGQTRKSGAVQDKVRPGTGREGALGYERYAAGAGLTVIDNTGLGIIKDIKVKLTLRFGHDGRNHGISGYIHNRTGHVQ